MSIWKRILVIGLPVFIVSTIFAQLIIRIPDAPKSEPKMSTASTIAVVTPEEVENRINAFRSEKALHQLKTDNPVLDNAAQVRAETMCAENDWTHDKAWQVLDPLYSYSLASENLHYDHLQEGQAANAVFGWANSPGHLKTMQADHTELAVGVKYCPGYQGTADAVLITSYYGVPR